MMGAGHISPAAPLPGGNVRTPTASSRANVTFTAPCLPARAPPRGLKPRTGGGRATPSRLGRPGNARRVVTNARLAGEGHLARTSNNR
eukprot:2651084-Lingulodinium_polyedra.AAC.1